MQINVGSSPTLAALGSVAQWQSTNTDRHYSPDTGPEVIGYRFERGGCGFESNHSYTIEEAGGSPGFATAFPNVGG